VFRIMLMSVRWPFFGAALLLGGLANGLAFLVLDRMSSLGHQVGIWRTYKDWALYREYRRIAPDRNWSRAPITIAVLSFVLAGYFMWLSMKGVVVPR